MSISPLSYFSLILSLKHLSTSGFLSDSPSQGKGSALSFKLVAQGLKKSVLKANLKSSSYPSLGSASDSLIV